MSVPNHFIRSLLLLFETVTIETGIPGEIGPSEMYEKYKSQTEVKKDQLRIRHPLHVYKMQN